MPRKVTGSLTRLPIDKSHGEAPPSNFISDIIADIVNDINDRNTPPKSAEEESNLGLNESVATLDDSIHTDALGEPTTDKSLNQEPAKKIPSTKSLN